MLDELNAGSRLSFVLLRQTIEASRENGPVEGIIWGAMMAIMLATTVGVLRRKRWGAATFILMQTALLVLPVLLLAKEDLPPLGNLVVGAVWVGINSWYFARRWPYLSATPSAEPEPVIEEPAAADGADDPKAG